MFQRWKKNRGKWMIALAILGPGLITASVDNDSGGIATYALAGAHFGYSLLWTLIPITLLLIFTLDLSTKLGISTRTGLAALIREKFRVRLTLPLLLLVLIANLGTTTSEFAGISSSFKIFFADTFAQIPLLEKLFQAGIILLCAVFIWVFILKGTYKRIEKTFIVLALFYVTYIISAILAKPDWSLALKSLVVPTFDLDPKFLLTMVGVIGTTITPWMYFFHNSTLVEKDVGEANLRASRIDALLGSIATDIISFFIIVAVAATIFVNHLPVETVADIGQSLVPLAGKYAGFLFAFGLLNASLFGAAVLPLSTAYTICEALGWETGIDKGFRSAPQFYGVFTGMIAIAASIILIPKIPLLSIMFISQVANGLLLPFFLVYLILLAEDEKLMGRYRLKGVLRVFGWSAAGILIVLNLVTIAAPIFGVKFI
ncbi:MAG: Nramp family divalent metal transporter [Patescibacteria group bacterium]